MGVREDLNFRRVSSPPRNNSTRNRHKSKHNGFFEAGWNVLSGMGTLWIWNTLVMFFCPLFYSVANFGADSVARANEPF